MKNPDIAQLEIALGQSWSAETSASSEWTEDNPALGQCAVTACVVQDYLGGDILNCIVTLPNDTTDSHYYNLIDGETVDLTREQFPDSAEFSLSRPKTQGQSSTRDYCLSFDDTRKRYELLKEKVSNLLGAQEK